MPGTVVMLANVAHQPSIWMGATVREAALEMKRTGIGAVIVRDGMAVAGILTERDLVHQRT